MVVPGHLADTARPILLAVTKGWDADRGPRAFARVLRQVKARLIEGHGTIQQVIGVGDGGASAAFRAEQGEELAAHERNGVRFLFLLVGGPERVLVAIPVAFDVAPR